MPFQQDNPGDNGDFSNVFATAAEERREEQERLQLQTLLRFLDERAPAVAPVPREPPLWWLQQQQWAAQQWTQQPPWAQQWAQPPPWAQQQPWTHPVYLPRVENLRVLASGDIERDDDEDHGQQEKRVDTRGRIHTLDDLPRDSLFDIFGLPGVDTPDEPPPVVVQSGRRLKDGKTYHTLDLPGLFAFRWSGITPELMTTALSAFAFIALVFAFFLLGRLRAALLAPVQRRRDEDKDIDAIIERAVDRAVQRRMITSTQPAANSSN